MTPTVDVWTHVAVTYDGTARLNLYVNGAVSATASNYVLGPVNDAPVLIGGSGTCGNTFPGGLDEVCIWRRALNHSQIAFLASGSGCTAPDGDSDGVGDVFDDCPTAGDPLQTDTDGDLAGDACEAAGSGNVDCNAAVNSVDALKVLRHSAGLPVAHSEPCLDIGLPRVLPPPDNWLMGDVDCSGMVNSVDALKVLRAVAALNVALPIGCPQVKPP